MRVTNHAKMLMLLLISDLSKLMEVKYKSWNKLSGLYPSCPVIS